MSTDADLHVDRESTRVIWELIQCVGRTGDSRRTHAVECAGSGERSHFDGAITGDTVMKASTKPMSACVLPITAVSSPDDSVAPPSERRLSRRRARQAALSADDRLVLQQIGNGLKEGRARRGWSQRELARRSGVDATHIAVIEVGADNATALTLAILARALRCSLATLVRGARGKPTVDTTPHTHDHTSGAPSR